MIVRTSNPFSRLGTTVCVFSGGHTYGTVAAVNYFVETYGGAFAVQSRGARTLVAVVRCDIIDEYPVNIRMVREIVRRTPDNTVEHMRALEQNLILHKRPCRDDCEDAVVLTGNYACVIDVRLLRQTRVGRHKPGRMAATLLAAAVRTLPPDLNAEAAIGYLTQQLHLSDVSEGVESRFREDPVERFTASVVLYSAYRREVWLVGHCQCSVCRIVIPTQARSRP